MKSVLSQLEKKNKQFTEENKALGNLLANSEQIQENQKKELTRLAEQNKWEASFSGILRFSELKEVKNREGNFTILGRRGEAIIVEGDKTVPATKLVDLANERLKILKDCTDSLESLN